MITPKLGLDGMLLRATYYLDECIAGNADCRGPLMAWRYEVEEARWQTADDVLSSNLQARSGDAANSFLFVVVPSLCFVRASIRFRNGTVLVTKAWVEQEAVSVNRLAA